MMNKLYARISKYSQFLWTDKIVQTDKYRYSELKPLKKEATRLTEEYGLLKIGDHFLQQ